MSEARHHGRYIPAETAWHGLRIGEVEVSHRDRAAGETKYGLFALLRVNCDMIASISAAPVQIIGMLGAFFALLGAGSRSVPVESQCVAGELRAAGALRFVG